eukprot:17590-Pelagococcus_subviridis.AAC.7
MSSSSPTPGISRRDSYDSSAFVNCFSVTARRGGRGGRRNARRTAAEVAPVRLIVLVPRRDAAPAQGVLGDRILALPAVGSAALRVFDDVLVGHSEPAAREGREKERGRSNERTRARERERARQGVARGVKRRTRGDDAEHARDATGTDAPGGRAKGKSVRCGGG